MKKPTINYATAWLMGIDLIATGKQLKAKRRSHSLTQEELSAMARIVNAYLDLAELRAEEQVPMTMEDWAEQFEGVLRLSRKEILTNAGSISAKIAEQHALSEFEKYRIVQDGLFESDFDRFVELEKVTAKERRV